MYFTNDVLGDKLGRLSVILTKSGKMTEVDARDVTILRIGSRKRGD